VAAVVAVLTVGSYRVLYVYYQQQQYEFPTSSSSSSWGTYSYYAAALQRTVLLGSNKQNQREEQEDYYFPSDSTIPTIALDASFTQGFYNQQMALSGVIRPASALSEAWRPCRAYAAVLLWS
jgi:CHASE2 domain-containing sensor protein